MTNRTVDQHRTIVVTFRVNAAEHAHLIQAAARTNLSPSVYLRHAALTLPIKIKSYLTLAPEDVAQLKRLGNLLNQIARAYWRGRHFQTTEDHLNVVLVELRKLLGTVIRSKPSA